MVGTVEDALDDALVGSVEGSAGLAENVEVRQWEGRKVVAGVLWAEEAGARAAVQALPPPVAAVPRGRVVRLRYGQSAG